MKRLKLSKNAARFIQTIPPKHAGQILSKINSMHQNDDFSLSDQLQGHEEYHRLKSGEYRIIFKLTDEEIFVDTIGKRNDDEVYKRFLRGMA